MKLDEIIRGMAISDRRGRFDTDIPAITTDSRRLKKGDMFVAIRGGKQDGHKYIEQAIQKGAAAIMAETWSGPEVPSGSTLNVILVPNTRRALALVAANFHGQPSRKLLVAGVTGTNGKTTVTYALESIVKAASKSVGVIGTIDCRFAGKSFEMSHTTPDPLFLQGKLAEMLKAGVSHVIMEVSSHALDQQRVTGIHFKVAGFTNLTHDHLDYHKDLDSYFDAKSKLFSDLLRKSRARGRMAVVNVDDARGGVLLERWGGKALSVSLNPESPGEVVALTAEYRLDGTTATVRTSKGVWEIETQLIGPHNLANVLVAIGMALAMGFSKARIVRGLRALERVPGRLERVPNDRNLAVFVDYAHTPDALRKVLEALRPLTKGRVIVVFGCGGDRDQAKRPEMGKVVAELADIAVITNDNPRSESPQTIASAIEEGVKASGFQEMSGAPVPKTFKTQLDRRAAIRQAVDWMGADDTLVIAGKGHETYQIIGREKKYFDDREEARRILAGLPPPPPLTFDDGTGEVDVEQVVETLELVENTSILREVNALGQSPTTDSIELDSIVGVAEDGEAPQTAVRVETVASTATPPPLPTPSQPPMPAPRDPAESGPSTEEVKKP